MEMNLTIGLKILLKINCPYVFFGDKESIAFNKKI